MFWGMLDDTKKSSTQLQKKAVVLKSLCKLRCTWFLGRSHWQSIILVIIRKCFLLNSKLTSSFCMLIKNPTLGSSSFLFHFTNLINQRTTKIALSQVKSKQRVLKMMERCYFGLLWIYICFPRMPISYQIVKDTSMTQLRKYEDMTQFRLGNVVKVTNKSPKDMHIYF